MVLEHLKRNWPDDNFQLHAGGWRTTYNLLDLLQNVFSQKENPVLLDLCCGEGSTVVYLAKKTKYKIIGIDNDPESIKMAKMSAIIEGVDHLVTFICKSTEDIPIKRNYIDLVYGQDPDSLVDHNIRMKTFKEIYRILKPGGTFTFFHHWIPSLNWSYQELKGYNDCLVAAQFYINDIKHTGFHNLDIPDYSGNEWLTEYYSRALINDELDDWLYQTYEYIQLKFNFGLKVTAHKPLGV